MQPLLLQALQILCNEQNEYSYNHFDPALKVVISKTIKLNLGRDRHVLDTTLYRSDPKQVLRRFTVLLPNARGVSKATLDSNAAAMKVLFKASGGSKAVGGGDARGFGGVSKASRGGGEHRLPGGQAHYVSTAATLGPSPLEQAYIRRPGRACRPCRMRHRRDFGPRVPRLPCPVSLGAGRPAASHTAERGAVKEGGRVEGVRGVAAFWRQVAPRRPRRQPIVGTITRWSRRSRKRPQLARRVLPATTAWQHRGTLAIVSNNVLSPSVGIASGADTARPSALSPRTRRRGSTQARKWGVSRGGIRDKRMPSCRSAWTDGVGSA